MQRRLFVYMCCIATSAPLCGRVASARKCGLAQPCRLGSLAITGRLGVAYRRAAARNFVRKAILAEDSKSGNTALAMPIRARAGFPRGVCVSLADQIAMPMPCR